MSFFSRIFSAGEDRNDPDVKFGRYTDSYKSDAKYDSWDESTKHFENKRFFESYLAFFEYLRDEDADNVRFEADDEEIRFKFYQGSKEISGFANAKKLKAESKIAKTTQLNIGFLRRLVESNYNLKYGRYCIDDEGDISIVFDTLSLDASPYKVYYALKEIALAADKQDDLLIEEFDVLLQVNSDHITALSEEEKEIKSNYLRASIKDTLEEVNSGKLNSTQYPGGITYLLLELVYRLDFLVRPEGNTMEAFERMHRTYFAADNLSAKEKNQKLIKELQGVLERPKEKLTQELYDTVSTFGITNPSNHARLKEFIEGEVGNMDWYQENEHYVIAEAIAGYIAGYCLFYYSLTKPDRDLLLLYFQIMHQKFFQSLGFELDLYHLEEEKLNARQITSSIQSILESHRKEYPKLQSSLKEIDFKGKARFAKSYMQMIAGLDLSKAAQ